MKICWSLPLTCSQKHRKMNPPITRVLQQCAGILLYCIHCLFRPMSLFSLFFITSIMLTISRYIKLSISHIFYVCKHYWGYLHVSLYYWCRFSYGITRSKAMGRTISSFCQLLLCPIRAVCSLLLKLLFPPFPHQ